MTKQDKKRTKAVAKGGHSLLSKTGCSNGGTAEVRTLKALAHFASLGQLVVDRKSVMQMADMKNESSFKTMCGTCKRKGFVEYPDGNTMKLTEKAIETVGRAAVEPKSNKEIQDIIMGTMKNKKTREMFQILLDGKSHACAELASGTGYEVTHPSFKTGFGGLSKFSEKTTWKDGSKAIFLQDMCFPRGRPNSQD